MSKSTSSFSLYIIEEECAESFFRRLSCTAWVLHSQFYMPWLQSKFIYNSINGHPFVEYNASTIIDIVYNSLKCASISSGAFRDVRTPPVLFCAKCF